MLTHLSQRSFRLGIKGLAVMAAFGIVTSSCRGVALLAPNGTVITLVSTTNVLAVNGNTDITAVLIEQGVQGTGTTPPATPGVSTNGQPVHDGTLVSFTTSLGRIEPAEATTKNGRVTVKLYADGRSGTATITAFSGASTKTATVTIGAAAAVRVLVTATPQSLPATGGTSAISAHVEDQQGNGLVGVSVSFSTTAGTLAATSAISNESGFATTSLTTTQAATVTASAGGGTGTLSGTVGITIKPKTTIGISGPATAVESTSVLFTVTVGTATVITDVTVNYGDGASVSLGALSSNTTTSHFYGRDGTFTVSATATDSEGGVATVKTEIAVTAVQLSATASPNNTTLGTSVQFAATFSPSTPSVNHFEWDFGEGEGFKQAGGTTSYVFHQKGQHVVRVKAFLTGGQVKETFVFVDVN